MAGRRCVVTIAVGKNYYLNLAENLLRSFLLWNGDNDINFLLLTDNKQYFENYFQYPKVEIKALELTEQEKSFISKFKLFENCTAHENLFIDCDCLIYGSLNSVFDRFTSADFAPIGTTLTIGDFFCDIKSVIQKFELSYLPKFVGSVYFFKKTPTAWAMFQTVNSLKEQYDEHGFVRLRGKENEEPLFAVAMAQHHQMPIADDGTIKADRMFYDTSKTNILTGKTLLYNKHKPAYPENSLPFSKPVIVHYNDSYSEQPDYLAEQYRLKHRLLPLLPLIILLKYRLPYLFVYNIKQTFRGIYHQLLGPSAVKKNKRL